MQWGNANDAKVSLPKRHQPSYTVILFITSSRDIKLGVLADTFKLFMHVLRIHAVKLDYAALAQAMGSGTLPSHPPMVNSYCGNPVTPYHLALSLRIREHSPTLMSFLLSFDLFNDWSTSISSKQTLGFVPTSHLGVAHLNHDANTPLSDCTAKAVTHRIAKLKEMARDDDPNAAPMSVAPKRGSANKVNAVTDDSASPTPRGKNTKTKANTIATSTSPSIKRTATGTAKAGTKKSTMATAMNMAAGDGDDESISDETEPIVKKQKTAPATDGAADPDPAFIKKEKPIEIKMYQPPAPKSSPVAQKMSHGIAPQATMMPLPMPNNTTGSIITLDGAGYPGYDYKYRPARPYDATRRILNVTDEDLERGFYTEDGEAIEGFSI